MAPIGIGDGMERIPIAYQKWILRQHLKDNTDTIYVFGDNLEEIGYGGQAREMRGEPNAYGIPTKIKPDMTEDSFFTDEYKYWIKVQSKLDKLQEMIDNGAPVIAPYDGLGTGLSQLPQRAPYIYATIFKFFDRNSWIMDETQLDGMGNKCPWCRPLEKYR